MLIIITAKIAKFVLCTLPGIRLLYLLRKLDMLLRGIIVSFFASITFAANWHYEIYVCSSFGVNTTSCWNGGDQTPCATLNLALQGLQYNSTVIYLYPGTYIMLLL